MVGLALVVGAAYAGWWWRGQAERPLPTVARPAPRVPPAPTAAQVDDCRDDCEQRAIVEKGTDAQLRACRARCGTVSRPPNEPIRSITVAPADHRPTGRR